MSIPNQTQLDGVCLQFTLPSLIIPYVIQAFIFNNILMCHISDSKYLRMVCPVDNLYQ